MMKKNIDNTIPIGEWLVYQKLLQDNNEIGKVKKHGTYNELMAEILRLEAKNNGKNGGNTTKHLHNLSNWERYSILYDAIGRNRQKLNQHAPEDKIYKEIECMEKALQNKNNKKRSYDPTFK